MVKTLVAMLVSSSLCVAQGQGRVPQTPSAQAQKSTPRIDATQNSDGQTKADSTITVPAGTRIALQLETPIHRSSARVGDPVRATTTFPVAVGNDVAIPQGTYVQGSITKIGRADLTPLNGLQIRFERLIFANGYSVEIPGALATAELAPLMLGVPENAVSAKSVAAEQDAATEDFGVYSLQTDWHGGPSESQPQFQQGPTPAPAPPPQIGPSKGAIVGAAIGATAVFLALGILFARHRAAGRAPDLEAGLSFGMMLEEPLALDKLRLVASGANSQ